MKEIWIKALGFETCWEVSNFGRIRSIDRIRIQKTTKHTCKNLFMTLKLKGRILSQNNRRLGYKSVSYGNKQKFSHRLVYESFHKYSPEVIDHINGDTRDNRLSNLRGCSQSENMRNQRIGKMKGISFIKKAKKNQWRAYITVDYKQIHIGCFQNKESAFAAYRKASIRLHGEYSSFWTEK
jgi:hypothetical protein